MIIKNIVETWSSRHETVRGFTQWINFSVGHSTTYPGYYYLLLLSGFLTYFFALLKKISFLVSCYTLHSLIKAHCALIVFGSKSTLCLPIAFIVLKKNYPVLLLDLVRLLNLVFFLNFLDFSPNFFIPSFLLLLIPILSIFPISILFG